MVDNDMSYAVEKKEKWRKLDIDLNGTPAGLGHGQEVG